MSGRRLAVVVTVEHHDDPVLRRYAVPSADVRSLASVLGDPGLGGFDVEFLQDPETWDTYQRLQALCDSRTGEDCLLVYFRGILLSGPAGGLYLATPDTVMQRPADTAVDVTRIDALMHRSQAGQIVIVLDGRTGGPVDAGAYFPAARAAQARSRVVITAAARPEPPTFAGLLADGIRGGAADRDRDGYIGIDEIFDHLRERDPTARHWVYGSGRQPYIAKVRKPGSDQMALIAELAAAAAGPDLNQAAQSRATLSRMATGNDRVAAAASAALRRTSLRVAETAIAFGRVAPGTQQLTVRLAVTGPPLITASTVTTSAEGLHAKLEGGELRVSWFPTVGHLSGTVTIDGPAGSAQVTVTGEVSENDESAQHPAAIPHPDPNSSPQPGPNPALPPGPNSSPQPAPAGFPQPGSSGFPQALPPGFPQAIPAAAQTASAGQQAPHQTFPAEQPSYPPPQPGTPPQVLPPPPAQWYNGAQPPPTPPGAPIPQTQPTSGAPHGPQLSDPTSGPPSGQWPGQSTSGPPHGRQPGQPTPGAPHGPQLSHPTSGPPTGQWPDQPTSGPPQGQQAGRPTSGAPNGQWPGQPTSGAPTGQWPGQPTSDAPTGPWPGQPTSGAPTGPWPGQPTSGAPNGPWPGHPSLSTPVDPWPDAPTSNAPSSGGPAPFHRTPAGPPVDPWAGTDDQQPTLPVQPQWKPTGQAPPTGAEDAPTQVAPPPYQASPTAYQVSPAPGQVSAPPGQLYPAPGQAFSTPGHPPRAPGQMPPAPGHPTSGQVSPAPGRGSPGGIPTQRAYPGSPSPENAPDNGATRPWEADSAPTAAPSGRVGWQGAPTQTDRPQRGSETEPEKAPRGPWSGPPQRPATASSDWSNGATEELARPSGTWWAQSPDAGRESGPTVSTPTAAWPSSEAPAHDQANPVTSAADAPTQHQNAPDSGSTDVSEQRQNAIDSGTDVSTRRQTGLGSGTDVSTRRQTGLGSGTDVSAQRQTGLGSGTDVSAQRQTGLGSGTDVSAQRQTGLGSAAMETTTDTERIQPVSGIPGEGGDQRIQPTAPIPRQASSSAGITALPPTQPSGLWSDEASDTELASATNEWPSTPTGTSATEPGDDTTPLEDVIPQEQDSGSPAQSSSSADADQQPTPHEGDTTVWDGGALADRSAQESSDEAVAGEPAEAAPAARGQEGSALLPTDIWPGSPAEPDTSAESLGPWPGSSETPTGEDGTGAQSEQRHLVGDEDALRAGSGNSTQAWHVSATDEGSQPTEERPEVSAGVRPDESAAHDRWDSVPMDSGSDTVAWQPSPADDEPGDPHLVGISAAHAPEDDDSHRSDSGSEVIAPGSAPGPDNETDPTEPHRAGSTAAAGFAGGFVGTWLAAQSTDRADSEDERVTPETGAATTPHTESAAPPLVAPEEPQAVQAQAAPAPGGDPTRSWPTAESTEAAPGLSDAAPPTGGLAGPWPGDQTAGGSPFIPTPPEAGWPTGAGASDSPGAGHVSQPQAADPDATWPAGQNPGEQPRLPWEAGSAAAAAGGWPRPAPESTPAGSGWPGANDPTDPHGTSGSAGVPGQSSTFTGAPGAQGGNAGAGGSIAGSPSGRVSWDSPEDWTRGGGLAGAPGTPGWPGAPADQAGWQGQQGANATAQWPGAAGQQGASGQQGATAQPGTAAAGWGGGLADQGGWQQGQGTNPAWPTSPAGWPNSPSWQQPGGAAAPVNGAGSHPGDTSSRRRLRVVGVLVLALLLAAGAYLGIRYVSGRKSEPTAQPTPTATQQQQQPAGGGQSAAPPPSVEPKAPVSLAVPVVVDTIKGIGQEPEGVVVSPDNRTVYVADQGAKVVFFIDANDKKAASVAVPNTPRFLALSKDGSKLYVSMFENDFSANAMAVIDTGKRTLIKSVKTGPRPFEPAVAADGRVWLPIHNGARVEIYDGTSLDKVQQISVPPNPHWVDFTPDGTRAFTSDHESSRLSVIDAKTGRVLSNIPVGRSPHSVAVTPDGRTVLVTNYDVNTVESYDTKTLKLIKRYSVGKLPQAVMVSPDGVHAYVVNEGSDTVSVLNLTDKTVAATIKVGDSPRVVALSPDGLRLYVTAGRDRAVTVLKAAEG
ncbi:hypothetical protein GCM10010168_51670 [Actinoplanes ianthinogenes]|uniref:40-residue YVTN family beta-propeller repeat-containing protein n=1 Tax=Actinoplanes ianthinogenes TaxID=122358 RepID=A0ABM7M3V8_9ACTN|nr:beta-propeller fold lactonase family protein [Actinoplanes ianthinogenes]BCJ46218.1 hypothetical protein Aiant_68750 [Actinoplanes ianthinogenes]GGR27127.1 hypothetical protein GCM10010168_51670 [Actinoplanes ianthinogenes]